MVLHYLQYASSNYEAHQVTFNKILCGIDIEMALPARIALSTSDISECDKLIETIIRYWEGLKDEGITTMQQMFISRKGKLSFKNNQWRLQVEQHAADALIGNLPWDIHTIKLPWLPHIIHTTW